MSNLVLTLIGCLLGVGLPRLSCLPIKVNNIRDKTVQDKNVKSFDMGDIMEAPRNLFNGYEILNRSKRIDRRPRSVKPQMTVCYPDGKRCLPNELCHWKGSVDRKFCKCRDERNCEAPYRKKGKHSPVKAACKFVDGRLQCFCFRGYEWSNSGKCIPNKETKTARQDSGEDKGGLPGSVLFAFAVLIMLGAGGAAAYCFIKRRRQGPDVTVTSPKDGPVTKETTPNDDDGGDAETALLADTTKLKSNKSRSRLSLSRKSPSDKKSKDKEEKSRSQSRESKKSTKKK